jgi:hypothetical protein
MSIKIKVMLTGLVCVFASMLTAGPAAAVGCYGNSCDGQGPVAQHCDDDGVVVASVSTQSAYGPAVSQLVWSRACHSFWARGHSLNTGSQGGTDPGGYEVRVDKRRKSDNTLLYRNSEHISSNTSSYDWTLMAGVTSTNMVHACVNMPAANSGDGVWHCTEWLSV